MERRVLILLLLKYTVSVFLNFVDTFSPNNYKLGDKFTNNKVDMQDIVIDSSYQLSAELLFKMKSIPAISDHFITEWGDCSATLIEKVIWEYCLLDEAKFDTLREFVNQISTDNEVELNLIKYFKRFNIHVFKNWSEFEYFEQTLPFWESIEWEFSKSSDIEIMTHPSLFKNGVKSFKFFNFKPDYTKISDKFLSNINEIKPKSIWLKSNGFEYKTRLNFIDLLSQLPNKMQIKFGNDSELINPIQLDFSKTYLKFFQSGKKDCLILKWKFFSLKFDNKYAKNIKVMHHSSEPNSECLIINLDNFDNIEFKDFEPVLNKEEIKVIDSNFPDSISCFKSKWTIVALAKDLAQVKLNSSITLLYNLDETVQYLNWKWSEIKSYIHKLWFPQDYEYFSGTASPFSSNKKYSVEFCLQGKQ